MKEYIESVFFEQEEKTAPIVAKDFNTGREIAGALGKSILPPMGEIFARHVGWPMYRRAARFFSR